MSNFWAGVEAISLEMQQYSVPAAIIAFVVIGFAFIIPSKAVRDFASKSLPFVIFGVALVILAPELGEWAANKWGGGF